jgi:hypothetical protein
LRQALDYETRSSFNLVVKATDGGGKSATANILVDVVDEQDQSPFFVNAPYSAEIPENTPPVRRCSLECSMYGCRLTWHRRAGITFHICYHYDSLNVH